MPAPSPMRFIDVLKSRNIDLSPGGSAPESPSALRRTHSRRLSPRSFSASAPTSTESEATRPAPNPLGQRVLLVEDNKFNQTLITRVLESDGFNVRSFLSFLSFPSNGNAPTSR